MKRSTLVKRSLAICVGIFLAKGVAAQTLQGALLQTLHTNPNILVAEKDRSAIAQALQGAKAGYLPTLDATAGYGVQYTESPFVPSEDTQLGHTTLVRRETGLAADEMLFDGFATSSEVKRNRARLGSADYKVIGTAQDIALNAVQTYLNVLKEQQLVKIAKDNVAIHQNLSDLIQKRNESGLDQSADMNQALGRVNLAKANLTAEQANLTDAQSNYLQIVGVMPYNLSLPLRPYYRFMPHSANQAVQMAVATHPVLKSAIEDMQAAYAQHKAADSPDYPRFDLQLSTDRNDNIDGVEGQNNQQQAMVRMKYNLFRGGADKARQNETAYLYQESVEVMHKTYRQVINNAQLSWNALQSANRQLTLLKEHRDESLKSFNAYQKQFQLSKRSLLDVLDAENEYYQSSRAYTEGKFLALYAQFRVLNSIGSLIQAEHIYFHPSSNNDT